MWLFKLPLFRKTVYLAERKSAVISFVVDLPALPVTATTSAPESHRTLLASFCNAAIDVGHDDERRARELRRDCVSSASLTIAPTAPFSTASTDVRIPVEAFTANRDEEIARRQGPRVDRKAQNLPVATRSRHARPDRCGDGGGRQRLRSSAARAIAASSNGSSLVPVTWDCSCPLPTSRTRSPGSAFLIAN